MRLSDSSQMYTADRKAVEEAGIPSTVLMETAAGHIFRAAQELADGKSVAVFCGSGNNGGDGVAAAAMLLEAGVPTRAFLVGKREKMTPDSLFMEQRLLRAGGKLETFDPEQEESRNYVNQCGAIIDAVFGIGLHRPVTGLPLEAVRQMNASGVPVIAADIPSGVSADTGAVLGEAVRCVKTVTFSLAKPGHFLEPGCVYCGEVEVCSIGIPDAMVEEAKSDISAVMPGEITLPRRPRLAHKGVFGKVLILGGSVGYTGAPNFCAAAAVRAGAGLVYLGVPEAIWSVCAVKNAEAMPFPLPCDAAGRFSAEAFSVLKENNTLADVLILGPGMGRSEGVRTLVHTLVREANRPLVLDADALWAISDDPAILRRAKKTVVITPHMGEFGRLGGCVSGERLTDARAFAANYGCITVLKGHHTVIAIPDGKAYIIPAGNPGMAKGGSGDVLSGILGAMLGQLDAERAAVTAAWLHAKTGDTCAEEKGEYGMTPTDIVEKLPYIMREITD